MYSEQNSNTFLSVYNQIDKLLDQTLLLTRYIPFNEKLQSFLDGSYDISPIVKRYQQNIRYFGDLRNQIVHGFRLDNQHYVIASDHAIQQIQSIYEHLSQPKTILEMFGNWGVASCQLSDKLVDTIQLMRGEHLSHLPVYDAAMKFVDVLDESTIVQRLASTFNAWKIPDLEHITLADMDLSNSYDDFCFIPSKTSVYQLRELFVKDFMKDTHKRLGVVFVTHTWTRQEPLQAMVTALDLPRLEEYFIS